MPTFDCPEKMRPHLHRVERGEHTCAHVTVMRVLGNNVHPMVTVLPSTSGLLPIAVGTWHHLTTTGSGVMSPRLEVHRTNSIPPLLQTSDHPYGGAILVCPYTLKVDECYLGHPKKIVASFCCTAPTASVEQMVRTG